MNGAEGLELVEMLLQGTLAHSAGQVVALLALRPGAPDGGALVLAVDAFQSATAAHLLLDVLRKESRQSLVVFSPLV